MSEPRGAAVAGREVVLATDNLTKTFSVHQRGWGRRGLLRAVDNVSLEVRAGETLGIVGESGCGKSTLGRCLVRLTDITAGKVTFGGRDISRLSRRQLRPVRKDLQLVFQDPYASLNPRRRVGDIIGEPLQIHGYGDRRSRELRVRELLHVVGLDASHADRFPHEFSGGQRQRVGIARALAMQPKVIVADEPVSALDVSIQAQVLNLFADLQEELDLTYVFIAHDLGVVRHVSTRIAVMYLGQIIELADAESLYAQPAHPYTQALLSAAPEVEASAGDAVPRQRILLTGEVPDPLDSPSGCVFRTRCPYTVERCAAEQPPPREVAPGRVTACHFPLLT